MATDVIKTNLFGKMGGISSTFNAGSGINAKDYLKGYYGVYNPEDALRVIRQLEGMTESMYKQDRLTRINPAYGEQVLPIAPPLPNNSNSIKLLLLL